MLKIFNKTNALFIIILVLSMLIIPSISIAQANRAAMDGSFITGDLCGFWTDARWQQEFTAMKEAGMHYLIIQAVADSYPGKVTHTLYPSSIPNTEIAKDRNGKKYPDIVDACLRNAELAGIKVFIGIDMSNYWWKVYGNDSTWLYSQMDLDNNICDELWKNYKSKYPGAFYGWYWSYEVDNVNWATPAQQQVLTHAMNIQLDHLNAANEKLPFMWCPFMNSRLGTPQSYEKMWENVLAGLHTSNGDIFCPQDCVGAGGLKMNQVVSWFSALRQAVNTKPGLVMWSDIETFDLSDNTTATMDRVISQLKIEQPYVDNYVSWEYCYYDSPNNIDPGFQKTYVGYLKTGSLDKIPPSIPKNFTAVLQPDGDIQLNWNAATDNIGVCGYYVYRNGIMICKKQVPTEEKHKNIGFSLTSLKDIYLHSNTNYSYQVKAYDFANNVSAPTKAIEINPGTIPILPNNVSLGCPYTVSIPAYTINDQTKNTKLTDGIYADSASIKDTNWEGFHDIDKKPRDVVIDLGKVMPVQQFIADYLLEPKANVYLPAVVKVFVSTDNINFIDVGSFPHPNLPRDESADSYKYRYTLPNSVDARYVKFVTIPSEGWYDELTFDDEYEVRNNDPSHTK